MTENFFRYIEPKELKKIIHIFLIFKKWKKTLQN